MSEGIPGAIVLATFMLVAMVSFIFLFDIWVEHDGLTRHLLAAQEAKVETLMEISNVQMSPDDCPAYTGPYDATIANSGVTHFTDFSETDVFVEYVDDSDNKVISYMSHGTDWSVSSLAPDNINPNQWDPGETATITFSLSPAIKADTNGVFVIASPQGVTDSEYFTCLAECGLRSTGFRSPANQSPDTGGNGDGFEITPTNAFADDNDSASSSTPLASGDNHRFYDYGLDIHSGCQIQGIEVRIDWWLLSTLGDNSMSVELSPDQGFTWTAAKTDTLETTTEHSETLGGPTDNWGYTDWTPDDFDNLNFRVRVTTNNTDSQDFFLDWVAVNVHYAPP